MRGVARAATAVVAALVGPAVPLAAATAPPVKQAPLEAQPVGTLLARAVPARAGARPAALRLTLGARLQCGRLAPGTVIVVRLPAAERTPAAIHGTDVLVSGRAPKSVALRGRVVTITLPQPSGAVCDVIAPGTATVVFSRAAGLGNPLKAGGYRVSVRAGRLVATAQLLIS